MAFKPCWSLSTFFLVAALGFVSCKEVKRLEETVSFDVKPSGQIAHETLKLVRMSSCSYFHSQSSIFAHLQENGVTCVFTYAAVGGTNEVTEVMVHIFHLYQEYVSLNTAGVEYESKTSEETYLHMHY